MAQSIAEIRKALHIVSASRPSLDSRVIVGPQAAVAVILRQCHEGPARGLEVLLIQRASHPNDPWSGHMALPGGKWESTDGSLEETAKRETHEEVGLDLAGAANHLGALQSVEALARGKRVGLTVTPHVFWLSQPSPLHPNPSEVQSTHWASLPSLQDGTSSCQYTYKDSQKTLKLPAFQVENKIVWGLTHRILTTLLNL